MDEKKLFGAAVFVNIISMAFYLGAIAYLGTFTRYISDDYCEAVIFQSGNVLENLIDRYLNVSDRFSNILFVGLTELAGPYAVRVLPLMMILLWLVGLTWMLIEANKGVNLYWPYNVMIYLALVVVFITVVQAPNRYQIFFWRSGMTTHFVPLVLLGYLIVYLLLQICSARKHSSIPVWSLLILLFASFMIGGFSEPPVAMMIVGLGMAFLYAWFTVKNSERQQTLYILFSAFIGSCLALLVMVLAPANSLRLRSAPPSLPVVVERSFRFAIEFMLDWIKTLPLPALFTVTASFMVSLGQNLLSPSMLTDHQRRRVIVLLIVAPLLTYLLIVASFAPSAYGQSFPVERARFAGQLFLVITLMIEGAGLGLLFAQWMPRLIQSLPLGMVSAVLLMVAAFYPLRAGWLALVDLPEYRARALAWDEREAQIQSLREQGETDLTVIRMPGIYGVKELDESPEHWVNRCAAEYYDVNSIRAIPDK